MLAALAAVKGLSHLATYLRVLKLKNEDFSSDPKLVESMNWDPLIAGENQTAQTIAELIRADEKLRADFPRITLPLLILHGTNDKAAKASSSGPCRRRRRHFEVGRSMLPAGWARAPGVRRFFKRYT